MWSLALLDRHALEPPGAGHVHVQKNFQDQGWVQARSWNRTGGRAFWNR